MNKTPVIVTGIAALSLLLAPAANAADMKESPSGNTNYSINLGGDTNVSQGNKCKNDVDQSAENSNGGARDSGASEQTMKARGKHKGVNQEAENTVNIKCAVGNIADNHPKEEH